MRARAGASRPSSRRCCARSAPTRAGRRTRAGCPIPSRWCRERSRPNPLTTGPSRAPARAMLKAVGFTDADLKKPLIGVANTWIEIGPCNYHLRDLAVHVKDGIRAAGGTPMEFNTVSISDGITMGTEGMRASLVSREVIADSIELVTRGNGFDGLVVLVGCDKTIPGGVDGAGAAERARASCSTAGRSRRASFTATTVTIQDVFEAVGAHARRHDERRRALRARRRTPVPAPAPAAASSPPTRWRSSASSSASRRSAAAACRPPIRRRPRSRARRASGSMTLVRSGVRPRDIITRTALENAIASVATTGGSTNAVLHLMAIAHEAGVDARARRLRPHQRARAAARRPEAVGALRRHRPPRGRRQPARRQAADRGRR